MRKFRKQTSMNEYLNIDVGIQEQKLKRKKKYNVVLVSMILFGLMSGNSYGQDCAPPSAFVNFEINLINASVILNEQLFTDPIGSLGFEYPSESDKSMIYDTDFWVSGLTADSQLQMAAGEGDFYAGPLYSDSDGLYTNPETCNQWDQFFVAHLADSELHIAYYNALINGTELEEFPDGYDIPDYFFNYPAMGAAGQLEYLAPFYDFNGDGIYNPTDGDCPMFDTMDDLPGDYCQNCNALGGDISVFWITNDMGGPHLSSGAMPLGIEIHNVLYGFENTGTELDQSLFLKKKIINRGTQTIFDFAASYKIDSDLGNPTDDYIGCDIDRNLAYCHNGDSIDEAGFSSLGYGVNPPAFGVQMLKGMTNPEEFNDNPMDGFISFNNSSEAATSDPETPTDIRNYQNSIWLDGINMTCGGDGYITGSSEITTFMFPGESGIGDCLEWTESSVGNPPGDRRLVVNEFGVDLMPGHHHCLIYAFLYAENSESDGDAIDDLLITADSLESYYNSCFEILDIPLNINQYPEVEFDFQYDQINSIFYLNENAGLRIYDSMGRLLINDDFETSKEVNLNSFSRGVYLVKMKKGNLIHTERILVN